MDDRNGALGDILTSRGMLTVEALQQALESQQGTGKRLGEVLMELGLLGEAALRLALAEQRDLPLVHPDPGALDPQALALVPEDLCRRYGVLPMRLSPESEGVEPVLTLAAADPTFGSALDDVAARAGHPIRVVAAIREEIESCLDSIYGAAPASTVKIVAPGGKGVASEDVLADPTGTALLRSLLEESIRGGDSRLFFRVREGEARVEDSSGRCAFAGGERWHTILLDRLRRLAGVSGGPCGSGILERGRFSFEAASGGEPSLFRVSILKGVDGDEAQVKLLQREGRVRALGELGLTTHQCMEVREALARPGLVWVTTAGEDGLVSTLFALLRQVPGNGRTFTIEEEVQYRTPEFLQLETLGLGSGERSEVLRELKFLDFSRIMVDRVSPAHLGELLALAVRKRWVLAGGAQASLEESLQSLSYHCADVPLYGLRLLIHQRLVPILCSGCRVESPLSTAERQALERLALARGRFYDEGDGCDQCKGKATRGFRAFFEVLPVDTAIRESLYGQARGERRIPGLLERVKPTIAVQVAEAVGKGEASVAEVWDFV